MKSKRLKILIKVLSFNLKSFLHLALSATYVALIMMNECLSWLSNSYLLSELVYVSLHQEWSLPICIYCGNGSLITGWFIALCSYIFNASWDTSTKHVLLDYMVQDFLYFQSLWLYSPLCIFLITLLSTLQGLKIHILSNECSIKKRNK